MFIQKIINAFVASKCTSTFFFFASFSLLFIFFFFFLGVEDDDKPKGLCFHLFVSFFICSRWRQTSLAHHHLFFSSCVADDGEPIGLSSFLCFFFLKCSKWLRVSLARHQFFVFFLMCSRWWRARRLSACYHLLGFSSSLSSLVASPLDASLLYLLVHGDVIGGEFIGYITTWCIIIVPSCTWGCHHPLTNAKVRRKGAVRYTTFG
jgi:hypothetical protein